LPCHTFERAPDHIELSYIELKKAFEILASSIPQGLKIFFMIDGIDEYEAIQRDLGIGAACSQLRLD
jgi:hypothetical protein